MKRFRLVACLSLTLLVSALTALAQDPPKPASGVHYLYLIRHGMYDRDSTAANDVVGNGLNTLGHEQAQLVGVRLAALPIQVASLVASNYRRARETAEDMGRVMGRKPAIDTLLHECSPAADRPDYLKSHTAEEMAACDSNLVRAWAKYVVSTPEADRHDVLVCHGNVIRWFVSRVVSGSPRGWLSMDIGNASITILAVRPDGNTRLVCYSDVGHLPVAKQTWTGKGWGAPPAR